jgi:hypothetical protein
MLGELVGGSHNYSRTKSIAVAGPVREIPCERIITWLTFQSESEVPRVRVQSVRGNDGANGRRHRIGSVVEKGVAALPELQSTEAF